MRPGAATALPFTKRFEGGSIPWFYLDTKGIVTGGVGSAFLSVQEVLSLPLLTPDGVRASAEQITADYERVKAMKPGLIAHAYRSVNSVHFSEETVNTLFGDRLNAAEDDLASIFPHYATVPVCAQAALVDMRYNLGPGRYPPHPDGFRAYSILIGAVNAESWPTAAAASGRDIHVPAFDERNHWTRLQFLAAAPQHSTN